MIYTEDDIKKDLLKTNVKEFYMKYLLRADNWYFERILNIDEKDIIHAVDDFKMLVSDAFDIGFNNTVMVGSAKLGMSLSPEKFLKHFTDEGDNPSDIDIAIISTQLFDYFWRLFRMSYNITNKKYYRYISRGIYRGYISDTDLLNIEECRVEWIKKSNAATKSLQRDMYFKHEMEKQRNQLQPIINSIDKELKNSGQIKLVLPEVGALELASTYRNKKIKPLFAKMKNYIAGLAAKVIELSREAEKWRDKYQQLKKDYDDLEKDADKVADMCNQLCDDVDKLEVISDKYKRALWIFGSDTIESAIWRDIQKEKALEEQKRKEQMPRKLSDRLQWGRERSQEHNMQQKKNKIKHKEKEL